VLHVREQGTTTASGVCECYYLVSSLVFEIVDILSLAAPEWFFSSLVSTLLTKILVLFIFRIFFC
jgi:hypothetical protein